VRGIIGGQIDSKAARIGARDGRSLARIAQRLVSIGKAAPAGIGGCQLIKRVCVKRIASAGQIAGLIVAPQLAGRNLPDRLEESRKATASCPVCDLALMQSERTGSGIASARILVIEGASRWACRGRAGGHRNRSCFHVAAFHRQMDRRHWVTSWHPV